MNHIIEKNPQSWLSTPLTTTKAISILIGIGLLVFLNSLSNAFVGDDLPYIVRNPDIQQLNLFHLFTSNNFTNGEYYRPLSAVYFALIYHVVGANPFLFHIIQLLSHLATGILFYFVLQLFFKQKLSFFLAAIFLIHPVQVESVSYISGATNVLLLFFCLLAFLISTKKRLHLTELALIFFCLFLALLAKETAFIFVGLIILYAIFFQKRLVISLTITTISSFIFYVLIRILAVGIPQIHKVHANGFPIFDLDLFHRVLNIPLIGIHYLSEFFFPTTLAFMQNWVMSSMSLSYFYVPLLIDIFFLTVIIMYAIVLYKQKRFHQLKTFAFFSVWFFTSSAFLLQIFPLDGTVADRWLYPVLPGLLGMIGIVLRTQFSHIKEKYIFTVLISIIILLGLRTIYRNLDWQNGVTLYLHDLPISEGYFIENALGEELIQAGQYRKSVAHLKKSLDFYQTSESYNDLGVAYQHLGLFMQAYVSYHKAIAISPKESGIPYYNLANMLILHSANPQEGISITQNPLLLHFPNNQKFWILLAVGEYKLHHQKEALVAAEKAISLANTLQASYVLDFIKNNKPVEELDSKFLE